MRPAAPVCVGMMTMPGLDTRRWSVLALLLTGQFMGLLDVFVVNVAMPAIGADLHASGASLQLVVGGYTISYAMLLITGARLGDLYGRRRMYHLGVLVFTAMSLACGLATSSLLLIVFRFAQGAGAAVMVPQIISVIQMQFTGRARAKALSAYGAVLASGAVFGLVIGGVLVSANLFGTTWRPVFLVNVPLGIVLAVLVPRIVPADDPRGTCRLDIRGLAIAVPTVFLVVLPLVLGHETGWPAWTFASVAAGLVLAAVFVRVERRVAASGGDALLNLDVLRAPGMAAGLTTLSCMQVAYGGLLFTFTLYLQADLGDSALRAGLTWIPMSAAFGLVSIYWRVLPERLHHALAPAGLAICVLAYVGISAGSTWPALLAAGAGMGLSVSPLLTQALVGVPGAKAADASGVLTTTVQLSQVLGVAGIGAVFLSADDTHGSAAISATGWWLAVVAGVGLVAAIGLSRTVLRASQSVAVTV
jgi:MFS family permease